MDTQPQKKFKVLLIGDSCIDEYHYGTVDRISPEAPVPVFKLMDKVSKPGMASNVRENLQGLGISVIFVSSDKSVKIRLIDNKSKQHIVRIDNDIIIQNPLEFDKLDKELFKVDCIVISDYNKGLISYDLVKQIRQEFNGPIFIDTKKKDLSHFTNCFVKINEIEYNSAVSHSDQMIITMGDKGAIYKTQDNQKLFEINKTEVIDVTGCGDTFLSSLVYKYMETVDIEQSIIFANKAAGVTARHMGVYAPKLEEIL